MTSNPEWSRIVDFDSEWPLLLDKGVAEAPKMEARAQKWLAELAAKPDFPEDAEQQLLRYCNIVYDMLRQMGIKRSIGERVGVRAARFRALWSRIVDEMGKTGRPTLTEERGMDGLRGQYTVVGRVGERYKKDELVFTARRYESLGLGYYFSRNSEDGAGYFYFHPDRGRDFYIRYVKDDGTLEALLILANGHGMIWAPAFRQKSIPLVLPATTQGDSSDDESSCSQSDSGEDEELAAQFTRSVSLA